MVKFALHFPKAQGEIFFSNKKKSPKSKRYPSNAGSSLWRSCNKGNAFKLQEFKPLSHISSVNLMNNWLTLSAPNPARNNSDRSDSAHVGICVWESVLLGMLIWRTLKGTDKNLLLSFRYEDLLNWITNPIFTVESWPGKISTMFLEISSTWGINYSWGMLLKHVKHQDLSVTQW